jgi:hypothetical protein
VFHFVTVLTSVCSDEHCSVLPSSCLCLLGTHYLNFVAPFYCTLSWMSLLSTDLTELPNSKLSFPCSTSANLGLWNFSPEWVKATAFPSRAARATLPPTHAHATVLHTFHKKVHAVIWFLHMNGMSLLEATGIVTITEQRSFNSASRSR